MVDISVDRLTKGEILLIHRRRGGESQEETASKLCLTRNQYGRAERDQENCVSSFYIPELNTLSQHEKCLIFRRRHDLTQEECAEKMGVTRFWFNQMETGKVDCTELVKFWSKLHERK